MLEQIEATIDPSGRVRLHEKIRLKRSHRAVVTVLDEDPKEVQISDWPPIVGSMELVDEDLESASREIADEMNRAIEKSAEELRESME